MDEEEGKIITPLPPASVKTGKIEGLVTPKPPVQFDREQHMRLQDVPDELKEEEDA